MIHPGMMCLNCVIGCCVGDIGYVGWGWGGGGMGVHFSPSWTMFVFMRTFVQAHIWHLHVQCSFEYTLLIDHSFHSAAG